MLSLQCNCLELRGIANKKSKNGTVYYVLYVENAEGKPFNFFVPKIDALPDGLKKGDKINVTFDLTYYNNQPRLNVSKVGKFS